MDEFALHMRMITRITLIILSIALFAWIGFPDLKHYFAGIMLGSAVSLLNAHYMAWKIRQVAQLAMDKGDTNGKRVNLGFVTRASTSLLAVIAAYRFPQELAFSTTLASLFLTQVLSYAVGIYTNIRYKRKGGS